MSQRQQLFCVLAVAAVACFTLLTLFQMKSGFSKIESLTSMVLSNKERLKTVVLTNTEKLKTTALTNNNYTEITSKPSAHTQSECAIKNESDAAHGYLSDFTRYPCVAGMRQDLCGRCVRTLNQTLVPYEKYTCVPLKIMTPTPICIYDVKQDQYVSGAIVQKGAFEHDTVVRLMTFLKTHPDFEFLDIGCNLGLYTLVAAKLSKRVVCVDPVLENTHRVATSLKRGNISENVTLIWNALYYEYVTIPLVFEVRNVGGTALKKIPGKPTDTGKSQYVNTIMLDDLTPLFKGKQVVIKMDVEQAELDVLKGGEEFFKSVDVRVIQMEVAWHRGKPSLKGISDILVERGFAPFNNIEATEKISTTDLSKWPPDVYFMKL